MNTQGNGGGNDWKGIFKGLIGMDVEEFVDSMVDVGEDKTMVKVFDYVNKREYTDEISIEKDQKTH